MAKHSTKENWEKFWEKDKKVDDIYPTSDSIVINLQEFMDIKDKSILEVGAGTGRDSVKLSEGGADLTVIDYADNALIKVKEAQKMTGRSFDLIRGDGTLLPFRDESFDVVFHQGLLEHFHDPMSLFMENVRVLKKGGYLLIDVPQKYHIYTVIKHILIWMDKWFAGWETEFSIGELRKFYTDNDLKICHEYGDWMAPSLFYRMTRELFKKAGLKLPMYPGSIPVMGGLRKGLKSVFSKSELAKYTFVSIGIIGIKE
ncbi:MAG: methyltransferase domain-containing protein [bacterium]|nr:methyltransferase domain-containing protein [bacterium]